MQRPESVTHPTLQPPLAEGAPQKVADFFSLGIYLVP